MLDIARIVGGSGISYQHCTHIHDILLGLLKFAVGKRVCLWEELAYILTAVEYVAPRASAIDSIQSTPNRATACEVGALHLLQV